MRRRTLVSPPPLSDTLNSPVTLRTLVKAGLVLLALAGVLAGAARAQPPQALTLSVPSLAAAPGDTVTVSVEITSVDNVDALAGIKLAVAFDRWTLRALDGAPGALLAGWPAAGFSFVAGEERLNVSALTDPPVAVGLGELLRLRFVVRDDAIDAAVSALDLTGTEPGQEMVMLDAADDPLPGIKTVGLDGDLTVFDGITCEAGDANPSGGIDVGDAIVVLRVAAGLLTDPTGEQRCGADADRNGRIDTGDAVWILRRVVGLPVAKVPATAPSPRVALERVGDRARLRIEPADAVHGLELVLAGDGDLVPGVLGPASDGLRVESALDGRRRVAWAAAEALGAGPLLLDLPVDWSAGGVEGRLTLRSLRLFAADGRTMSASMERATLRLAKEVVGPRVLELTSAPNPFNPVTTLRFELARAGRSRLEIYNAAGARVDVLLDETLEVGAHEVAWNGTDRAGRPVASGVYFARLTTDGASARRRLLLVK